MPFPISTSLKQKTVNGLLWSFIDTFAGQGIQFVVGIILARILSPREFGLIGMIVIFISISESFVNSGFKSALIQKKDCTQTDYSTVFYFNFIVGIIFYWILFLTSPAISNFFKEPELKSILKVLGSIVIFDSLIIIQKTILYKRIDFKLQTRISFIAALCSGTIAIFLAYSGYGVWSLVIQRILNQMLICVLLWIWNKWWPTLEFSKNSFKELFGFGSKLLIGGFINTIYSNAFYAIIGKYYSASELGFYSRADQFKNLPSSNLNGIINRVSFPVLASIQNDKIQLKKNYKILIRSTSFLTFLLMMGMFVIAKPLILTLIGEKWLPSVVYLQLLCFVGMFFPLNNLNLNMLQVQGKATLFLKLELIKNLLTIPTLVIGIIWGIKLMILGMIANTIIAYYINSNWSGTNIDYTFRHQIKDIFPSFILAMSMAIFITLIGLVISVSPLLLIILQIISGIIYVIIVSEIIRFTDYIYIKRIVLERIKFNKK